MFLQPQHFQLADLHMRFRLKPLLEVGLPYCWGISQLDIAPQALADRTFELRSVRLLLKDGTYVEYPGNAVIKPRGFDLAWKDPNKPFRVYLAIKKPSLTGLNVAVVHDLRDGADMNVRCLTTHDAEEFPDLYSDGPVAEVKGLSYVVRVLWEDELVNLTDYEVFPAALLERNQDTIRQVSRFIPPSHSLNGSKALYDVVKEIRDEISARAHQLEQYKSPREMQKAEFDASYMVFLLALRTLNRYTPLLHHYLESPHVHPWVIYGVLRQLIGELSSFSERCNMLGEFVDGTLALPSYDHLDLGHCLFAARAIISQLLNEITVGPDFLALLEPRERYLVADLPKRFFDSRNRFYLVLRSESGTDALVDSFQSSAKLAALDDLPTLIRRALPGVELIHMPVAPQGLPRRSYSFYFRIDTVSKWWEKVEKNGNIALDWPDAPHDLKAELVVLRR